MLFSKAIQTIMVAVMPLLLEGFNTSIVLSNPNLHNEVVRITVSIDILKSIVSPIISDFGEVHSIVSGEVDPHVFTLTPEAINIARGSDLIIITGHMMWEKELVNRVAGEKGVSADLISINIAGLDEIKILELNGEKNIHGFWLLPDNVIVLAREIRGKLSILKPGLAQKVSDNYERFEKRISNLKSFLRNISGKYGLYNKSVVIGFYEEHYVAEAMGLKVGSILIGEEELIRPETLRSINDGLKSGKYACLIISDVALLMGGVRNALERISEETGSSIAYVLAVSSNSLGEYDTIMYYNAGQVYGALLRRRAAAPGAPNIYLLIIAALLLTVLFETALLVRGRVRL